MSTYPFSPADYAAARWWNRYLLDYRCHLSTTCGRSGQEFSPGTFASMFLRDRAYHVVENAHSLGFGFDRRDDEDLRVPHKCWPDEEDVCNCYYDPSWSNRLRQYDEIISLLDQSLVDAGLGRAKICASSVDDGFLPYNKLYADRFARLELTLGAHRVRAYLSRFVHS